jgi:hypothetical protein
MEEWNTDEAASCKPQAHLKDQTIAPVGNGTRMTRMHLLRLGYGGQGRIITDEKYG